MKYRGIEARRRDVPFWVKKIQLEALSCMAKAKSIDEVGEYLPEVNEIVNQAKRDLRNGHVPLEELVLVQSLSRAVEGYTTPSPSARAAMQLLASGIQVSPGQFMRFVFVRGKERVRVWEFGLDARMVDVKRYCTMLDRAVGSLVSGFERAEEELGI